MIQLDSSILIELFRKKDKKKTTFYRLSEEYSELFISSIALMGCKIYPKQNADVEFLKNALGG